MVTLNLLGLNTSTTCFKLHDLHKELNQQNQGVTEAYGRPILNQLLKLIENKDKQVKILACCCLADIFRIYAPEAPFNEKELVQIFSVFFRQLLSVKDPAGPLFPYYFYLLETISTIKCVCLLGQLRSADDLISQLFRDFFEIIGPEMTMTLQVCIRDVLYQLIEEFNFVSQAVIELIVSHFSSKIQKSNPSAFRLAVDLCNMCDDKLQRYVCQYFGDVMIAASKNLDDEDTFKQFEVSHNLILEIFEHVPSLLLNVVPQLEEELKVETIIIRQLATDSLGKMFSKKGSKWVDTYPHIFKSWCDRRNDKNILIRIAWVKYTGSIVQLHPDMTQTMEPMLKSKLMDPDEKVRVAAIQAIGLVCQEHPNLLDDVTLREVSHRCRDKKMAPRAEAIQILSKLFHTVYNLSLQDSEMPIECFMWIPGSILELLYLEDQETRIMVEKVLVENLFPPNSDNTIRTVRLLRVLSSLNEKQHNAFLTVLDRQVKTISTFSIFIDQCVKFNATGSAKDEVKMILEKVIPFLCHQLPDPKKAESHLRKLAELRDGRLYKLMRAVMDPTVEFKNVLKHSKEICTILGKHAGLLETMTIFLRRISLCIINKNLMEVLLGMLKNGKGDLDKVAESFIKDISRIFPALYKNNIYLFVSIITNPESKSELVDDTVEVLSKFVKSFPDYLTHDKEMAALFPKLVESLVKLCLSGTVRQAKNAAILLAVTGCSKECKLILKTLVPSLTLDFKTLIPKLACIKSLAYYCNSEYSPFSSQVINLIVSKILMKNEKVGDGKEADWSTFEELEDEGKAKVLGLKILVKPLLIDSPDNPPLVDIAKSVMKLCRTLLASDGELLSSGNTWASFKTHLRLNAGLAALKLLALPAYAEAFEADDFNKIGLLIQDPIYYVRSTFVERLIKYLVEEKIPVRYSMWLTLAAHEPEVSLKSRAKGALIRIAKSKRSADGVIKKRKLLETHFSDFCQLLSHHPDFSMDHEDLELFEVYVQFYLETVATDENISYLYASAAQLKMVKDKYLDDSTPLYVIAEMLILRIREYCAQQNWTLVTYPGKFSISRDFYLRLDDEEISNNLKKVFYKDGQERLQKIKRQPALRTAAIKQESSDEEEEDEASSGDSDATQVERKRVKLSSSKETSTATRRSERAKKPLLEQRQESGNSDLEN